jgi:hypothetical protein
MNEPVTEEMPPTFALMGKREFIRILLLGAGAGIAVWGLGYLLDAYVFQAALCQNNVVDNCAASPHYAAATASVVVAVAMLLLLVRVAVFRPLLVVLATTISLWGFVETLVVTPWYFAAIASALLYAAAYGTFVWLARMRNFWIALIAFVVLLVAVRFVITS